MKRCWWRHFSVAETTFLLACVQLWGFTASHCRCSYEIEISIHLGPCAVLFGTRNFYLRQGLNYNFYSTSRAARHKQYLLIVLIALSSPLLLRGKERRFKRDRRDSHTTKRQYVFPYRNRWNAHLVRTVLESAATKRAMFYPR